MRYFCKKGIAIGATFSLKYVNTFGDTLPENRLDLLPHFKNCQKTDGKTCVGVIVLNPT